MIAFPNAKINLGLRVTEKRPDGYHNLISCFYPIGLYDALEIVPARHTTFTAAGIPIPEAPGDSNLIMKAYQLLARDYPLPPVSIHLIKSIPIGAGLGGGSADASFCIRLLNELASLNLTIPEQEAYARQLGSDCAFFIRNTPRYCFGKGDQFEDITLSLKGRYLVLINPGIHIATAAAYHDIVPAHPETDLRDIIRQPVHTWRDTLLNDFEKPVFSRYPLIAAIKKQLYEAGALYAGMSGSGATVYGIFEEPVNLYTKYPSFFVWQKELS